MSTNYLTSLSNISYLGYNLEYSNTLTHDERKVHAMETIQYD